MLVSCQRCTINNIKNTKLGNTREIVRCIFHGGSTSSFKFQTSYLSCIIIFILNNFCLYVLVDISKPFTNQGFPYSGMWGSPWGSLPHQPKICSFTTYKTALSRLPHQIFIPPPPPPKVNPPTK